MRAFVIRGPGQGGVEEIETPVPAGGEVVVDVSRAGLCGTDVELFAGTMPYLATGEQAVPMVPGHEWTGTVSMVGGGVNPGWAGRRVTADPVLGCGRCARCAAGLSHMCDDRYEIGIRRNRPGALAERLRVPAASLRALPDTVDDVAGALVEPAGCAHRAVAATDPRPGQRACVFGPGTLGLLALQFLLVHGVTVDVVGVEEGSLELARSLGAANVWTAHPDGEYDTVIDATPSAAVGRLALRHVRPAGRVVLLGIADAPSTADLRDITLKDLTVIGVNSAAGHFDRAIAALASGHIRTAPLLSATVGLHDAAAVLAGHRPGDGAPGPKIMVDPRIVTVRRSAR